MYAVLNEAEILLHVWPKKPEFKASTALQHHSEFGRPRIQGLLQGALLPHHSPVQHGSC